MAGVALLYCSRLAGESTVDSDDHWSLLLLLLRIYCPMIGCVRVVVGEWQFQPVKAFERA